MIPLRRLPPLAAAVLLLAGCGGAAPAGRRAAYEPPSSYGGGSSGGFMDMTRSRCASGDPGACRILRATGGDAGGGE